MTAPQRPVPRSNKKFCMLVVWEAMCVVGVPTSVVVMALTLVLSLWLPPIAVAVVIGMELYGVGALVRAIYRYKQSGWLASRLTARLFLYAYGSVGAAANAILFGVAASAFGVFGRYVPMLVGLLLVVLWGMASWTSVRRALEIKREEWPSD